jgi:dihydroxy-acid dehydratase
VPWLGFYVNATGLETKCALMTDGTISGFAKGSFICQVSLEAAEGGFLALVQDGDTVEIDIPNRKLNLLISQTEPEERRRKGKTSPPVRPEVRSTNGGEIREENGNTPG